MSISRVTYRFDNTNKYCYRKKVYEISNDAFFLSESSAKATVKTMEKTMENSSNIKLTKFELFQLSSRNFLCQKITDNWQELDDEEQDKFVQENVWQPLENRDSWKILELIDDSTCTLIEFLKEKRIEVSD